MSQGPYNPYPPQPQWGPPQPPGYGAPQGPGGPWGPQHMQPPPPPQKSGSSAGKVIGIGCLALIGLMAAGGAVAFVALRGAVGGSEVASAQVAPAQPFVLQFQQNDSSPHRVWLELDAQYTQGLQIPGRVTVTVNGQLVQQHTLAFQRGGACENPTQGQSSSFCMNWVHSNLNGSGSTRGKTRLFEIPAQARGATVAVSGMLSPGYGTTASRLRVYVAN